jgi:hypothetical protein
MSPITPSWFKQRQAKAEAAGENLYKLTGPNLKESYIGIRPGSDGRWSAFLRYAADGPDADATEATFSRTMDAWEAAFEVYRVNVIV